MSAPQEAEKLQKIQAKYEELSRLLRLEDVPAIDIVTLRKWQEKEGERPVLVDVRTREECEVSTLPGALWQEEFERDSAQYTGRKVVSFCTIGARSGSYTKKLRAAGVDAYNLQGSVLAWTHGGHPLVCRPIGATSSTAAADGKPQPPPPGPPSKAAGTGAGPPGTTKGPGAAGEQPTRRVHVYGKDWALAADGYDQVWFTKRRGLAEAARGLARMVFSGWR